VLKCATYSASTTSNWRRLRIKHPIQQLTADGADPSFGDSRSRGARALGAQDADGFAGEHGVQDAGERAVAIPDQAPELSRAVATSINRLRPCWVTRLRLGWW
jgi:hypothetical protein